MLTNKRPQKLFHSLRCEVALGYILSLILLSLFFSQPFFLLALLLALNQVIFSSGIGREWLNYLRFSLPIIFMITLVNSLFVRTGATVLLRGPYLPIIGTVRVTLESLCFSAGMGIRLLVIMGAFCLFTYAVSPDKVLKILGGRGSKTMLALSLSLRLFPLLTDDFVRITEAQRCRGVSFQSGSHRQRLKKYIPILNTVLLSSLERSFQLAESLQSRGFGMAQRSRYQEELWRPRDILVLFSTILGSVLGVALTLKGWAGYHYYPRLQTIESFEIIISVVLMLIFIFPALLNWGWEKWRFLRLKI